MVPSLDRTVLIMNLVDVVVDRGDMVAFVNAAAVVDLVVFVVFRVVVLSEAVVALVASGGASVPLSWLSVRTPAPAGLYQNGKTVFLIHFVVDSVVETSMGRSCGPHLLMGTNLPLMGGGEGGSGFLVVMIDGSTTWLVFVLTVNLRTVKTSPSG